MKKIKTIDWLIVFPYLFLCATGVLMIYSTSSFELMRQNQFIGGKAIKQLVFVLIGMATAYFFYRFRFELLFTKNMLRFYMLLSFMLLILVGFTPLGVSVGGAQRWIPLGGINIQPSEIVNVVFVLYLANYFSHHPISEPAKYRYKKPLAICSAYVLLVLIQPNMGGALMLIILATVLFLASGVPVIITAGIGGIAFILRYLLTHIALMIDEQRVPLKFRYLIVRFQLMNNPFLDEYGKGYQTSNSYYAMYNGGFFGRGYGQSLQKKSYLPAADTDFIFSIIIEELGLIGGIVVLVMPFIMVLRIIYIGIHCLDSRKALTCFGIACVIFLQVSVNVGSLLGYIPMTGVTFPFVSYGGSSLIILSLLVGIALNISHSEGERLELRSI
ncbi:FtsW/RodA/SpoVE family cell cycle protein [uncultured Vagococcus sp.]|uniref:FtsW/RodA/SpoVE family cell cycle protein n=1 Tax=uncultured Vagococcus sp. TaxID=189676 RepID=UPI0028D6D6E2|nr:FtsW/RodA/SpoVE family cell cycle protein [uncultured Vagococcus sp.]